MTRRRRDEGAIAILTAVLAVVLFGFAAIVVDLGLARQTRRDAQDGADAAALAGADALFPKADSNPQFGAALTAIQQSATANVDAPTRLSSWTCPAPLLPQAGLTWDGGRRSRTQCVQFGRRGTEATSLVFVAMPTQHVSALFGGIFGARTYDISENAIAGTQTTSLPTCGMCVFGTLTLGTGSTVQVSGGSSLSVEAVELPAAPTNPPVVVVKDGGQVTFMGPATSPDDRFDPRDLVSGVRVDDPLDPDGDRRPTPRQFITTNPVTCDGRGGRLRSGTYTDLRVTGDCRLRGVYVVRGDMTIQPGGSIDADDATLVFDDDATFTNLGGRLQIGQAGRTNFSVYWSSSQPFTLAGPQTDLDGDVYARGGDLVAGGDVTIDGALVADSITLENGADLEVSADADSNRVQHSELGLVR